MARVGDLLRCLAEASMCRVDDLLGRRVVIITSFPTYRINRLARRRMMRLPVLPYPPRLWSDSGIRFDTGMKH